MSSRIKFQYIDDLYSVWHAERESSRKITPIKPSFFSDIKILKDKFSEIIEKESDPIIKKILGIRLNRLNYVLKDLIEIRTKKISNAVIENKKIEVNLAQEEYAFYSNFQKLHKFYVRSLERPSEALIFQEFTFYEPEDEISEETSSKEDTNIEYIIVRFSKDVKNEIVGVDGSIYGPFKKEDICKLPKENANSFITHDIAEKVEL